MDLLIYQGSLVIIIFTTTHAIFAKGFADNLPQRLGLAITSFGCIMRLLEVMGVYPMLENSRYLQGYGVCLFCIGTYYKFWKNRK